MLVRHAELVVAAVYDEQVVALHICHVIHKWQPQGRSTGTSCACYVSKGAARRTPCLGRVYDALPHESRTARVQLLLPQKTPAAGACVLHLAATGDQNFRSRSAFHCSSTSAVPSVTVLMLQHTCNSGRSAVHHFLSNLQTMNLIIWLGQCLSS